MRTSIFCLLLLMLAWIPARGDEPLTIEVSLPALLADAGEQRRLPFNFHVKVQRMDAAAPHTETAEEPIFHRTSTVQIDADLVPTEDPDVVRWTPRTSVRLALPVRAGGSYRLALYVDQDLLAPRGLSWTGDLDLKPGTNAVAVKRLRTLAYIWLEHPSQPGLEYKGPPISCALEVDGLSADCEATRFHLEESRLVPGKDLCTTLPRPLALELGADHQVSMRLSNGRHIDVRVTSKDLENSPILATEIKIPFPQAVASDSDFQPHHRVRGVGASVVVPMTPWKGSDTQ